MSFAHSGWLWLLPLALVLAALDWRAGGPRRVWTATLRLACAASFVFALARPLLPWRGDGPVTVAVVELGPTADGPTLAEARTALRAGSPVVAFGTRAEVIAGPGALDDGRALAELRGRLGSPLWADDTAGGANLADALRLAGTRIPFGTRGAVRLFSTGKSDHGDAAAEAWRLARRGIAVEARPLAVTPPVGVAVTNVRVPAAARVGQTVRAMITVRAAAPGRASVRLTAGRATPVTISSAVVAGENRLAADLPLGEQGLTPVRAAAWVGDRPPSSDDDVADVVAAIGVAGPSRVLLVHDPATAAAPAAYAALLGRSAELQSAGPDELTSLEPAAFDAIVLADVPAARLTPAWQASLRDAVSGGTGLLVTGAAKSFGPGGYDCSPLASLLPVTTPQQAESVDPSTTLVLILDTSSSMAHDRIDLAKEVARLAISHLKPQDKVGIVEFYGGKRWAAPIQSAGNRAVINRALDRLTAGGGTTLYPALEEAAFALRNVHTQSKHVLICSDGDVENSPFDTLVPRLAEDGVAVSTVAVVPTRGGGAQMADIARWGGGRFYTVPDQYALPDLSLKRPQSTPLSPVVRTPSAVAVGDDALLRPATIGPSQLASVSAYVRTQAKPTADVLLRTGGGDPLLARWRCGNGFVACLPTQLGSNATAALGDDPQFARLFADLLRQLGSARGQSLRVTTTVRPAGVEIDVTAADGRPVDGTLALSLTDASGLAVRTTSVEAIGPAHWNVLLPGVTAGAYGVTATLADGPTGRAAVAVPPPRPALFTDDALLGRLSDYAGLAAERAASLPGGHTDFFELCKPLAVLAAVLLLTQVAVRRWPAGARGRGVASKTASVREHSRL